MTEYEQLLQDAYDRDLFVHEDAFIESGADGMIYDTLIYLSDRLVSCREKTSWSKRLRIMMLIPGIFLIRQKPGTDSRN